MDEWGLSQYGCCPDCGAGGDGREDISLAPTEEGNHWEDSESEDDGERPGPIHDAAIECDVEALRSELGRGVSANQAFGDDGKTPLLWLCASDKADWAIGGAECFHVLLAAGADINAACDIGGDTPLSEAACRVHPSLQLLLEAGAKPGGPGADSRLPEAVKYTQQNTHSSTILDLLQHLQSWLLHSLL